MRITLSYIGIALCVVWFSTSTHSAAIRQFRINQEEEAARVAQEIIENHKDTLEIIFTGDVMQHTPQINVARTSDGSFDFSPQFEYVKPIFEAADLVVANLETTLSDGRYSGYPLFRTPRSLSRTLAECGVDIAALANNHCCDGGAKGVRTTIETLNGDDIKHTGVFLDDDDRAQNNPLILTESGVTIAIYNYTYGTNGMPIPRDHRVNLIDTIQIKNDLKSIPTDSIDCVIAIMHWGYEYQRHEHIEQRKLASMLQREGVDVVIGHHPHVVQPIYTTDDGKFIVAYSLGNFVSNQRKQYTDGGIMARLKIVKSYNKSIDISLDAIPTWVKLPNYQIIPPNIGDTLEMTPQSRQRYEEFLVETNQLLGL